MKDDELFIINVVIAGSPYQFRIPRSSEECYRKAAKMVNDRFNGYQQSGLSNVPHVQLFSIIAMECAVQSLTAQGNTDMEPFVKKIETINSMLDNYLKEEK